MIRKLSLIFLIITASSAAMTEKPQSNKALIIAAQTAKNRTFIPLSEINIENLTLGFSSETVRTRNIQNTIKLYCDNQGFIVQNGQTFSRIKSHDVDQLFKGRDLKEIAHYALFNKFQVSQLGENEYKLEHLGELKGGGLLGASIGWVVGKSGVSLLGHGSIHLVSWGVGLLNPAVGVAVHIVLEQNLGPIIEIASLKAGIAGSIIGGAGTGPV